MKVLAAYDTWMQMCLTRLFSSLPFPFRWSLRLIEAVKSFPSGGFEQSCTKKRRHELNISDLTCFHCQQMFGTPPCEIVACGSSGPFFNQSDSLSVTRRLVWQSAVFIRGGGPLWAPSRAAISSLMNGWPGSAAVLLELRRPIETENRSGDRTSERARLPLVATPCGGCCLSLSLLFLFWQGLPSCILD